MPRQVPFTEYEAALLLDAYLKTLSGEKGRMESVRDCSMQLRQMALNAGSEIDDICRNVNGISFQMASMESAYQGHTIMKPATRLFTEIVLLYRNDVARYQQLLKEAKGMASAKIDMDQSDAATTVSFRHINSMAFSKPVSLSYFGEVKPESSWKGLYVDACKSLLDDYPDIFTRLKAESLHGSGKTWLVDAENLHLLAVPKQLEEGLFVETNRNAFDLVKNLKWLLDECSVDYENVVITYTNKDGKKEASVPAPVTTSAFQKKQYYCLSSSRRKDRKKEACCDFGGNLMESKLRECFDEMVVYKDLKRSNFFSSLGLPSFLRDWVLKKFEDDEGNYDIEEVTEFIQTYLPRKEEWISIKNRIIYENERVKILTKVGIDIDIKTGDISFSLPAFGLSNKETIIEPHVWDTYKEELTNGQETWGVIELGYRMPDDTVKPKILGKIKMTGFANFCPYVADLDFFKDARAEFTVSEWIDVVLGAIDYNAQGYKDENEKLAMLARLLPFVEKRLNLLELAPKGTGKSYVFGNVSKYGLLTDGGKITRTKMFYDKSRRAPGFIVGNDFVAIDEVKLVTFDNINEMRSIMQGYMERGRFNVDGYDGESFAGVVLLGNISIENMDEYTSMFSELPVLFQESALVDRIHGFIKGWDIPKMKDNLKASGWALNSEYFCTVMHMLRDDASYRAIVDALVDFSDDAYVRHTEAVKRIATAYLKLLFPNVRTASDVNPKEFMKYCLRPAIKMRKIIWRQLSILDAEYKNDDKLMPEFTLKEIRNEA